MVQQHRGRVDDRSRNRTRNKDNKRDGRRQHRDKSSRRVYEKLRRNKGAEREVWEFHNVVLTRLPGYGFGIAVSGGRDNPHFTNGDPSIAISDVLKAGPAEGKLQINDRVISANGISLENVDYTTAVQVLRECGNSVSLVIKRRIVLPPSEPQLLKVTLTKGKKKDDFGVVLGCWIYIKEITNPALLEKEGGIQEGDIIMKVNSTSAENLTLKEAKKMIENSKEKLQLVVKREIGKNDEHMNYSYRAVFDPFANYNKDPLSPTNFIDVSTTRSHWSNQNVYVQSPTRRNPRISNEISEDKNNLSRSQVGWNKNILNGLSNNIDQVPHQAIYNHLHLPYEDQEPVPPRPPLPRIEELDGRKDQFNGDALQRRSNVSLPDPRFISYQKETTMGICLTGGNEVGIFVTAVQPESAAFLQGLQAGDKILKVNDRDMRGLTREDAVKLLLSVQEQVNLIVQHRVEEYEYVMANQKGDSFYIRTHFKYENYGKGELKFHSGEVFHVVDTLYNGVVGSWLVYRVGRNRQDIQRGIIPNRTRADKYVQEHHQNVTKKDSETESRGSFFRRRARRSKSLSKDHWEDVVFADAFTRFPAYEQVVYKHPGFMRPVVLFGPLADIVRDKLTTDYPEFYDSPQLENQSEESSKNSKSSGIIRLSAIKEVIDKGKHAVLDITPSAVDRLNYAQFYPIVIFIHSENKQMIKEVRSKWAKTNYKSSRKLYEHALKLEKLWSHIFTATICLTSGDAWYTKLLDSIDKQQNQAIWISESKPEEMITDDFLFPMTSRLSYSSSPESDLDLAADARSMSPQDYSMLDGERHIVKASSDSNIATQANLPSLSNYSSSSYTLGRPKDLFPYNTFYKETNILLSPTKDGKKSTSQQGLPSDNQKQYSKGHSEENESEYFENGLRSRIDPYATLTPSERLTNQFNTELQAVPYILKQRSPKHELPPRIDRSTKPLLYPNAHDRPFHTIGRMEAQELSQALNSNYVNTPSSGNTHNFRKTNTENIYSNDPMTLSHSVSPTKYKTLSPNERSRSMHDPYRFTRSTSQPIKSTTLDRNRGFQSTDKFMHTDGRPHPPSPPPKPASFKPKLADGRPVPPPKPTNYQLKQFRSQESNLQNSMMCQPSEIPSSHSNASSYISTQSSNQNSSMVQAQYYSKESPKPIESQYHDGHLYHVETSNSYLQNSGIPRQEDTSNHNYNIHYGTKEDLNNDNLASLMNGNNGQYCNISFSKNSQHQTNSSSLGRSQSNSQQSSPSLPPPPNSLLNLYNMENRGSAFELYKKPDSHSLNNSCEDAKQFFSEDFPSTHNVVDTAQGVFDHLGGTLTSKETGVTIIIPPGAISEGEEHNIYFKVCQDSSMLPPLDKDKGETLLSPLVMCGPHGLKFNIPVELRLPHRASISPDRWSFALKSSDTPNGEPVEWQNVSLDSKSGVTSSHVEDNYVSVLVDHF